MSPCEDKARKKRENTRLKREKEAEKRQKWSAHLREWKEEKKRYIYFLHFCVKSQ